MKSYFKLSAVLAAFLCSLTTQAAPAGPVTVYNSMADLTNLPPTRGQIVVVTGLDENNPFPTPLIFTHSPTSTVGTAQFPMRTVAKGNTNGLFIANPRWSFKTALADQQRAEWWGIKGDGITDNYTNLTLLLNYSATNAIRTVFPRGRYHYSKPLKYTGYFPLNWESESGHFRSGWFSTNETTETRFVYTGSATNAAFSIGPDTGLLYGVNLDRLTFDANGNADAAIRFVRSTRGYINQLRARNSKQQGILVDFSFYLTFINPSVSANEEPFSTAPGIGIQLTNAANQNTFISANVSGTTNWAVEIVEGSQPSVNNTFIDGGFESNTGGAIHLGANVLCNSFSGTWIENNGATNRQIQLDADSIFNSIERVYMESGPTGRGNVALDGIYNTIENSRIGTLTLGSSSSHNILRNLILDVGQLPTPLQYAWEQRVENVIDATATMRMNIMPDDQDLYGSLHIYEGNVSYPFPRMDLAKDHIFFGTGQAAAVAGWSLPSGSVSTLVSSNTLVTYRSGANDGILSSYIGGDTHPRVSLNIDTTFGAGSGSAPVDTYFQRIAAGTWKSSAGIYVIRTNSTDGAFATYPVGSGNPTLLIREGGSIELGAGGTSGLDITINRSAAGRLHVDTDFEVSGGIYLGGVYRSSWPSSGGVYTEGNGIQVSAGNVISTDLAAGANITLTTNGAGVITIASSGSGGATNGTPVSVNAGGTLAAANFQNSSNVTFSASGSNITAVVTNSGVTPGAYTSANITVGSDGRIISAANGSSGGSTNATAVTIDGGALLSALNLKSSTNVYLSASGSNVTVVVTNSGVTPGAYALLTATVGSDGRVTSATVTPVGKGLTNNAGTLQLRIAAGSNITLTTNGNDITIAATSSGSSNGTPVNVNGGTVLSAANIRSSSNIVVSTTSTNIDIAVTNSGVTAGAYNYANITVGADGRVISASTNATTGSGPLVLATNATMTIGNLYVTTNLFVTDDPYGAGWDGSTNVPTKNAVYDKIQSMSSAGGAGTNIFVKGTLLQPAQFTNSTKVNWSISGNVAAPYVTNLTSADLGDGPFLPLTAGLNKQITGFLSFNKIGSTDHRVGFIEEGKDDNYHATGFRVNAGTFSIVSMFTNDFSVFRTFADWDTNYNANFYGNLAVSTNLTVGGTNVLDRITSYAEPLNANKYQSTNANLTTLASSGYTGSAGAVVRSTGSTVSNTTLNGSITVQMLERQPHSTVTNYVADPTAAGQQLIYATNLVAKFLHLTNAAAGLQTTFFVIAGTNATVSVEIPATAWACNTNKVSISANQVLPVTVSCYGSNNTNVFAVMGQPLIRQ